MAPNRPRGLRRKDRRPLGQLRAALELLLEQGVDSVNFEQISKRTGYHRTTIYRRWKTRRELLDAAIRGARVATIRDPDAILRMAPNEFFAFIEETIVAGLVNPVWPTLLARLAGVLGTDPELLTAFVHNTLEPGRQLFCKAIDQTAASGAISPPVDSQMLGEVLESAILHRAVLRAGQTSAAAERVWVRRLMRQLGLLVAAAAGSRKKKD